MSKNSLFYIVAGNCILVLNFNLLFYYNLFSMFVFLFFVHYYFFLLFWTKVLKHFTLNPGKRVFAYWIVMKTRTRLFFPTTARCLGSGRFWPFRVEDSLPNWSWILLLAGLRSHPTCILCFTLQISNASKFYWKHNIQKQLVFNIFIYAT